MTERMEKNRRLTRRQLAATVAMSAMMPLCGQAPAKPDAELQTARDNFARNRELLAKVPVAMATEPSFKFVA